ncbi:putative restriction-modification system adenine methylase [Actinacidiphila reveromycinica]|uniref:Putative restriction-modification system adenine methylase n=1 Tax=Actinacidiphila reveromycinica TaxID=659352 RepID=A0A7U3UUR4_9ACTN|nr:N-6 DNA methylase [Streptomyces sp. SN-593]BBA99016.1 putative restriction-modification system adenine methylase [Streptomyces sp. SN-593]
MTSGAEVTAAEIARIAGVGPAAVSNWRRRYAEFPTPTGGTAASPQFSLSDVMEWLEAHGRPVRLSPTDEVWRAMEALRDPGRPGGILVTVGLRLLDEKLPRSGRADAGALPEDLGVQVDALREQLGAGPAFEVLLGRWVEAHARHVEVTPAPVAALMCALVGTADDTATPSVLDPACGTGSLLLQAAEDGTAVLLGQEIDADLAEITALRLRLRGHHDVSVAAGSSLLGDVHSAARVQGVVCNLPFGQRDWGRSELGYDIRWTYGLPPRGEPELAWVQHALAHLHDGGRAVLLMPAAAASRPSGRRIRAELLRRGTLRGVVALPPGSTSTHTLGTHLWLLQPGDERARGQVLFVNTELLAVPPRENRATGTDWTAVRAAVSSAWRQFQEGTALDPAFSRAVPVTELLDEDVDITPARHVGPVPGDAVDAAQLKKDQARWLESLTKLAEALPAVRVARSDMPSAGPRTLVSLEDLIGSGALRMWRGSSGRAMPDETAEEVPQLTLNDGLSRTPPSSHTYDREAERIRDGDVLVFAGMPQGARPADPWEVGAAVGPGIAVLRPEHADLDSWFLAGALTASPGLGRSGAVPGTSSRPSRLDPGRFFLPVREPDDQRLIGRAFRDIARFEACLDQAVEHGRGAARHLADALAAGLADPIDDDRQG